MSKLRKPGKNAPKPAPEKAPEIVPLDATPEALVEEWRALQGKVAEANQLIKDQQEIIEQAQKDANEAQSVIQNINNLGLQVIGQANAINRVLAGMGVDPNKFGLSDGDAPPVEPAEIVDISAEVPEEKEDSPSPSSIALRKRFRR